MHPTSRPSAKSPLAAESEPAGGVIDGGDQGLQNYPFRMFGEASVDDRRRRRARRSPVVGRVDHVASRTNGRGVDDDGPRRFAASNAVGEARTVEYRRASPAQDILNSSSARVARRGFGRVVEPRRA